MAWMRNPWYVWGDGENTHISDYDGAHLVIDDQTMEELVVMWWHDMSSQEREDASQRALQKHGRNFGSVSLAEAHGRPTALDYIQQMLDEDK